MREEQSHIESKVLEAIKEQGMLQAVRCAKEALNIGLQEAVGLVEDIAQKPLT